MNSCCRRSPAVSRRTGRSPSPTVRRPARPDCSCHRRRGTRAACQPPGEVGEGEVGPGDAGVVVDDVGVGAVEPAGEERGVGGVEPAEAEGGQLPGHRVGADGERPAVDGGLDGRVAEPLPGGRQHDDVAGRVGVGHVAVAVVPAARLADRAAGAGEQPVELGAVAVLGRPEEPVRRRRAPRPGPARRRRSCGRGPGRLEDEPVAARPARARPGSRPAARPAGRGRRRCRRSRVDARGRPAGGG